MADAQPPSEEIKPPQTETPPPAVDEQAEAASQASPMDESAEASCEANDHDNSPVDPTPKDRAQEAVFEDIPVVETVEGDPDVEKAKQLTKESARDLRVILSKYVDRHMPEATSAPAVVVEPPRKESTFAKVLPWLRTIPYLLCTLFAISFLWDFPGATATIFGKTFVFEGLLRIIAVSGMIGFLTNWLAITMLFNPREKRPIFGQGLIPAQRDRVIYRLAKAISDELINERIIKEKIEESQVIPRYREMALTVTRGVLEDDEFRTDLKQLTASYVDNVLGSEEVRLKIARFTIEKVEQHLGNSLGGLAFKAYRMFNEQEFQKRVDQIIKELPRSLDSVLDEMDQLLDKIPERIEARSEDIENWATRVILGFVEKLDVYSMIMSNMANYDEAQLENLLKRTSNEQFNYIKYLGGILGALGGLLIWESVIALVVLGTTVAILWGLDVLLYNASGRNAKQLPPAS